MTVDGRKVLVTGAAGFLGSHLCELLREHGCEVWALDNFDDHYDPALKRRNLRELRTEPEVHVVEGDIRDSVLLDGLMSAYAFDAVVHLAALPGVRTSLEAPDRCLDVNVAGTATLLEAMTRHGVHALTLASGASVYGDGAGSPSRETEAADRPISPYAASKRAGELLCHAFHVNRGLSVHCLRIFTAYGPRQRPDMAIHKFARLMRNGRPVPVFGDGSSERDYTYVADVVEGFRLSLERLLKREDDPEYEVLNLGRGETTRLDALVTTLGRVLGVEPVVERLPEQPGDATVTLASVERSREVLGWESETDLEQGLTAFVDWMEGRDASPGTTDRTWERVRPRRTLDGRADMVPASEKPAPIDS